MADRGMSHVALVVRDAEVSIAFYSRYAAMKVVHERTTTGGKKIVWLSDLERPFALVLIEDDGQRARLEGIAHLGVACESREHIDRLCRHAESEGILELSPHYQNGRAGYLALVRDPDGHNLELSHGQEVGVAVSEARCSTAPTAPV